ncbi:hypothetical protein [Streptomyces sp. NPDC007369]|uniref:hypothetical protein n=1 Tax=Streptomyces sp. NPDC007369 TaxID=3154589 RepID=UPI00340A6B13
MPRSVRAPLAAFVAVERRSARALPDLSLLRDRTFAGGTAAALPLPGAVSAAPAVGPGACRMGVAGRAGRVNL